jgi:chemotaxis protein methyltransferase CheR
MPPRLGEVEFVLTDADFAALAMLVKHHTGIILGEQKRNLIYSRLARRLRALKLESFAEYCDLLETAEGESEIGEMVNAITTNLTSFFRERHHFDFLGDEILKPLLKQPGPRRLRIWSAGCSSGEETYSIAMVLRAAIPAGAEWDAKILGTDIDTDMLARAKAGDYERERAASIPERYRRYIGDGGDGAATMAPELRALISFKPLNLLDPWPMRGPFDAIFCRNVVIYFDKETQRGLFDRFAELLAPAGWLFIGHSETLFKVSDRFRLVGRTIYRKIR